MAESFGVGATDFRQGLAGARTPAYLDRRAAEAAWRRLGLKGARSSYYRALTPRVAVARRAPPRRLSSGERELVLTTMHEPRFADLAPAEVYATLLDEGMAASCPGVSLDDKSFYEDGCLRWTATHWYDGTKKGCDDPASLRIDEETYAADVARIRALKP
ncbi:hypothetical protein BH09MYX1_BH09MYX1_30050 [soil metagenome]